MANNNKKLLLPLKITAKFRKTEFFVAFKVNDYVSWKQ